MAKGRDSEQVMGRGTPGETEGGRRPTGVSPGELGVGPLGQGQRWTAARKREVVLRLFRGEPLDLVSRELGVELYRLEKWRDAALAGMEEALKARNGDPLKAELDTAMQRIGELTMENELLWVRVRRPGPLAKRRSKK
jgi:transposase